MPLPKIQLPLTKILVPSLGREALFRPFTVREEKILLQARASEDDADILLAVHQVVNNCSQEPEVKIDDLAIFDLEWLFLRLRAISVSNVIDVTYEDEVDGDMPFRVNLDTVAPPVVVKAEERIPLSDTAGLVVRYPRASVYADRALLALPDDEKLYAIMKSCIVTVWDGEAVYPTSEASAPELDALVDSLSTRAAEELGRFIREAPTMRAELRYTGKAGKERVIALTSLTDFFTLR